MHEYLDLITERLARLDHRIHWQVAGPQLAHGTCRHCGLDVRVEHSGELYSTKMQSFGRCGSAPVRVARPHANDFAPAA